MAREQGIVYYGFLERDQARPAQVTEAPTAETSRKYLVTNQTAYRIGIAPKEANRDGSAGPYFQLSLFGEREITEEVARAYNFDEWEQHGLIKVEPANPHMVSSTFVKYGHDLWDTIRSYLWKSPYVVLIILIGWVLPFLTILALGLDDSEMDPPNVAFLGRTMQWLFIGIVTTLPATLYVIFGRLQLETVRVKFNRDVLMLDPSIRTTTEAGDKYKVLFEDAHGLSGGSRYRLRGAALPLVIATTLITLGWTLTLLPIGVTDVASTEPSKLMDLFVPPARPMVFGFLGAYFFSLNMIFRRYVLGDLTPKTFNHISVRLVTTTILVWVIAEIVQIVSGGPAVEAWLLALAFVIGIVPEAGTTYIQETARRRPNLGIFSRNQNEEPDIKIDEEHPLINLEGITIYDRSRFQEVGINNIENLAHHNLIELLVRVGVTTERIVDLFDQAILYLHLGLDKESLGWSRQVLREYGIRTATDLLIVYEKKPGLKNLNLDSPHHSANVGSGADRFMSYGKKAKSGDTGAGIDETAGASARGAFDSPDGAAVPTKVETIYAALQEHQWVSHLRYWRSFGNNGGKSAELSHFLRFEINHDSDELLTHACQS
jgi:hypothetical protein